MPGLPSTIPGGVAFVPRRSAERPPAAWPAWLPENPFLLLAMRRHRRQVPSVLRWLCGEVALLGGVLAVLAALPPGLRVRWDVAGWAPVLFGELHLIFCFLAGTGAGMSVLVDEYETRTLDGLRLLPWSPLRWVLARLAFPLLSLAVMWAAGLPVLALTAAVGVLPAGAVERFLPYPLLAGVCALLASLLHRPDYREGSRQERRPLPMPPAAGVDGRIRDLLAHLVPPSLSLALVLAPLRPSPASPFFEGYAPGVALFAAAAMLLAAAGLASAVEIVDGTGGSTRWARVARLAAFGGFGVLALGVIWRLLPAETRPLAPVLLLLPLVPSRQGSRADPWSRAERAWLEPRLADPLLLRDLRAVFHVRSLRRRLLHFSRGMAPLAVVAFLCGRSAPPLAPVVAGSLAVLAGVSLFVGAGARVRQLWEAEAREQVLPLLFLTPLPTETLVRNRIAGALLLSGAICGPVLLLAAGAALVTGAATFATWGPRVLALAPLAFLPVVAESWPWTEGERGPTDGAPALRLFLHLAAFAALAGLLLAGRTVPPLVAWLGGLAAAIAHSTALWMRYRWRVTALDRLRAGAGDR